MSRGYWPIKEIDQVAFVVRLAEAIAAEAGHFGLSAQQSAEYAAAAEAYAAGPSAIPYESPAYRQAADRDGNGLLDGDELLPLYQRAARDFLQPLFAYGAPRLVRLGVQLEF